MRPRMYRFEMVQHPRPNILQVYVEREKLNLQPPYQRVSDVWDERKRRLLIDSIVNGVDLPKIYFHELSPPQRDEQGRIQNYAVVDGKQRLETIFSFLDGELALPEDFRLFEDESITAGGFRYDDLARRRPRLRALFDRTDLPIVVVRTSELEFIEELFTRLNEAVALNAPEYRNALGGPLPRMFRELIHHAFFVESLPFESGRHKHLDLAAKFTHLINEGTIQSTKKGDLDRLVVRFRQSVSSSDPWLVPNDVVRLKRSVDAILTEMHGFFAARDRLLSRIGWVTLLFHLFRLEGHEVPRFSKRIIEDFYDGVILVRKKAREISAGHVSGTLNDREQLLAQFDSLRQSPNDASALRRRYELMRRDLGKEQGVEIPPPD